MDRITSREVISTPKNLPFISFGASLKGKNLLLFFGVLFTSLEVFLIILTLKVPITTAEEGSLRKEFAPLRSKCFSLRVNPIMEELC